MEPKIQDQEPEIVSVQQDDESDEDDSIEEHYQVMSLFDLSIFYW